MSGRWAGAEVKRFRELWASGVSTADIAKEFGRSENSVRHARKRLDLKPRNGANLGIDCISAPRSHRDMFRETDAQAAKWRNLLARAS